MSSHRHRKFCMLVLLFIVCAGLTGAQIIIIPPYPPPRPPILPPHPMPPPDFRRLEYRDLQIDAHAIDQKTEVQLTQTLGNPGETPIESEVLFSIPEGGAIGNVVLMADGKELPGKLLDKNEARSAFEEIIRKQRDPALLEYVGRGLYRASVFPIPAHGERKLTLRYSQLLKKDGETISWLLPIGGAAGTNAPARAVLRVQIDSSTDLKSIYSPTHGLDFTRDGAKRAHLDATLTAPEQLKDFQLYFSTANDPLSASVLSWQARAGEDGYILLLASPGLPVSAELTSQSKTVIFVLDRSGSMTGGKIEQAREALKFVLKQLRAGDTFNIIVYDDRVEAFKPELAALDEATRAAALQYVDGIRPGGSTNIADALQKAMEFVSAPARRSERPSYILFLTDGLPTAGETSEQAIAERTRKANTQRARLLVWGVGDDVNARLLDRLSGENGGASDYVRPNENIEAGISRTFSRMTSPILTSPSLELAGLQSNRMYPRELPDFFAGSQLVLLGRYPKGGSGRLHLKGLIGGKAQDFSWPVTLDNASSDSRHEYIARLWATRRIGDLLDQIDLKGQNAELTDEIVALSKQFGIMTPYTSYLAREDVQLAASPEGLRGEASRNLANLARESGELGVRQRAYKQSLNRTLSAPAAAAPDSNYQALDSSFNGQAGMFMGGPASSPQRGVIASGGQQRASSMANNLIRNIAAKTFYWKTNRWQDATLAEAQLAQPVVMKQFSPEWFELSRRLSATENQYLSLREAAILMVEGKVYLIEP